MIFNRDSVIKSTDKTVAGRNPDGFFGENNQKKESRNIYLSILAGLIFLVSSVSLYALVRCNVVFYRFTLNAPEANKVALVGSFNNWQAQDMFWDEDMGVWELQIPLKKGRTHQYNFIINDAAWITDPKSYTTVLDSFGEENSTLEL